MAKRKIIERIEPVEVKDNTSRMALGISILALVVALFALLGQREGSRVGGINGRTDSTLNQRIDNLETRAALGKAQAELLILTQRIQADPAAVNIKAELDDIKLDLEEFASNPDRKIQQEWNELITDLNTLSESAGRGESVVDKINLLIYKIQQEIKNEGKN